MLLQLLLPSALAAAPPPELGELVGRALRDNPTLDARSEEVAALDALRDAADAWPDPVVGIEASNLPLPDLSLDGHGMAGLQVRAQQVVPFPGVPALRQEVAGLAAEAGAAALAEARVAVAGEVEATWWRLARERWQREITLEHLEVADQLLDVARARYEAGHVEQHALLRIQVQRERLADRLREHDRQERVLTARLAALLHEAAGPFPTPPAGEVRWLPPEGDLAAWKTTAAERRPALAQWDARRREAERAAALAQRDALPDLTLWGGYRLRTFASGTDPGTDLVSAGVAVPLAFVSSARAGRERAAAATARARAARAQREALLDRIGAGLEAEWAGWARAADQARVWEEEVIPAARAALEAAMSTWSADRTEFETVYQSWVQLLEVERRRLDAIAATRLHEASMRRIAGTNLPGEAP